MKRRLTSRGFTIIEVLIVLAIAAVILLIVFRAVPALNRSSRNTQRKEFVAFIAGAMDEYKTAAGSYPDTPATMCNFMNTYLKARAGGGGTCNPSYGSGHCVRLAAKVYTVCYHDRENSEHSYEGPVDEISIQLSHWCTPNPNPFPADEGNPITSGDNVADTATYYYVIWTEIEPEALVCRDNYGQ